MDGQYIINSSNSKVYRLVTELRGQNSGCARWGFAECDGEEYFIKEFISPVYPDPDSPISDEMRDALISGCVDFENKKNCLYSAINASSNGNIIGIKDFFKYRSHYYIVTEKVETGMYKPSEIAALSFEKKMLLLRVLMYNVRCIHDYGIVHADLKPSNLIVKQTQNGFYTVKLIDFDSSFFENDQPESTEEIQGDMSYLAPETFLKIAGEDIVLTTKVDVFSLGIIFHEFLCGVHPAIPSEYDYVYEAVLDGAPVKLSHRIPEKMSELISAMLLRDPDRRPSAKEIFDILVNGNHQTKNNESIPSAFKRDTSLD